MITTWVLVGLADVWVIGGFLGGLEIWTILQGLVAVSAPVFVQLWLSLRRRNTLQNRLANLLDSIVLVGTNCKVWT